MTSEDLIDQWIGCDKCHSAKAIFLVKLMSGELYFCGHHLHEYSVALDKAAYEIIQLNRIEEVPQLEKEEV